MLRIENSDGIGVYSGGDDEWLPHCVMPCDDHELANNFAKPVNGFYLEPYRFGFNSWEQLRGTFSESDLQNAYAHGFHVANYAGRYILGTHQCLMLATEMEANEKFSLAESLAKIA